MDDQAYIRRMISELECDSYWMIYRNRDWFYAKISLRRDSDELRDVYDRFGGRFVQDSSGRWWLNFVSTQVFDLLADVDHGLVVCRARADVMKAFRATVGDAGRRPRVVGTEIEVRRMEMISALRRLAC
jgi:hypothetical protein